LVYRRWFILNLYHKPLTMYHTPKLWALGFEL
jgi:hypothetical protein